MRTDQPRSIRDKQVTLVGSGLSQGQTYDVWLEGPSDNKTTYTGISFSALAGGLMPPSVVLPLTANSPREHILSAYQLQPAWIIRNNCALWRLGNIAAPLPENAICHDHGRRPVPLGNARCQVNDLQIRWGNLCKPPDSPQALSGVSNHTLQNTRNRSY